jgi:hypothetical protein
VAGASGTRELSVRSFLSPLNCLRQEVGSYRCDKEQRDDDQQKLGNGPELLI